MNGLKKGGLITSIVLNAIGGCAFGVCGFIFLLFFALSSDVGKATDEETGSSFFLVEALIFIIMTIMQIVSIVFSSIALKKGDDTKFGLTAGVLGIVSFCGLIGGILTIIGNSTSNSNEY
ncbi:hypothetical protein SCHIN_v1c03790 [Spiroplasma chinense]|uniref:Uncharacterized protein n=1 Tax=Spiroplasma chinense TaxID=216932 RepID=A0A5B9Y4G8_9MOLU|nr:hypothetical protein [Spiroplasma chinense]QEH61576.1 hypothetical protein SCHIN_v1c03790 [Spiroplasma chinense]